MYNSLVIRLFIRRDCVLGHLLLASSHNVYVDFKIAIRFIDHQRFVIGSDEILKTIIN